MADAMDEEALIDAVAVLKLANPGATAKEVHDLLTKLDGWADESLSRVKKACSKEGLARKGSGAGRRVGSA